MEKEARREWREDHAVDTGLGLLLRVAWRGGDQPVAVLRCYGGPGCCDSSLQLLLSGSGVSSTS